MRSLASPLRSPRTISAAAVIGAAFLILPIVGLLTRVRWATLVDDLLSASSLEALRLSLLCASAATVLCLVIGLPLAVLLARMPDRAATVLRTFVLVPLVLPPMVGGVALLSFLGRNGLLGAPLLAATGLALPYTTAGVIVAEAFVALPFLVITLEGALRTIDPGHERIAATLGAGPWRRLLRITLPLAAPGLLAGTVLSFARALGEFGAAALFAGNAEGVTRTMPLAIYTAYAGAGVERESALAMALLLLASALLIVAVPGVAARSGARA